MTVSTTRETMPDVQSRGDTRQITIQKVGVRRVRYPFTIQIDGQAQPTVADWELTVALPAEEKGTHMSRFIALLEEHRHRPVDLAAYCQMAVHMLELLDARQGEIQAEFPIFINKVAPISKVNSLLDYRVRWIVQANAEQAQPIEALTVQVTVPVTSLCPCSKEISQYGAHNQRSHVIVDMHLDPESLATFNLTELISGVEAQGSCQLWGLLKRTDEKYVTEHAYENPKFVEDLVRDVAVYLNGVQGVQAYRIEAENFESIHNHSAYAVVVSQAESS